MDLHSANSSETTIQILLSLDRAPKKAKKGQKNASAPHLRRSADVWRCPDLEARSNMGLAYPYGVLRRVRTLYCVYYTRQGINRACLPASFSLKVHFSYLVLKQRYNFFSFC